MYVAANVAEDAAVAEIADRAEQALRIVPPERVAQMARSDVHQGVVAQAAPLRAADLDTLLAADGAFLVALDGVTDPHNLGAVMRSAETGRDRHDPAAAPCRARDARRRQGRGRASSTCQSARRRHPERARARVARGLLERRPRRTGRQSLLDLELADQRLILVLGAEGRGLARLTRDRCDMLVRIPMYGHVASLNVDAAAAPCHEVARRRHT